MEIPGWTDLQVGGPSFGAAGLAVFPIRPPDPKIKALPGARRRTDSSAQLGTLEYVTSAPGEALESAIRDSERSTVFTLRIPAGRQTWRRMAPWLRIYSGRNRVFARRLFVPKDPPLDAAAAEAEFRSRLCRIAPAIPIEGGAAGRVREGLPELRLRSRDWALTGPEGVQQEVEVAARFPGGPSMPRFVRARFIRTGEWARVWPVPAAAGTEFTISSAAGEWTSRPFLIAAP